MELTNEQWSRIEPIIASLATKKDPRGRRGRDPREVLNGILWILRTGGTLERSVAAISAIPNMPSAIPALGPARRFPAHCSRAGTRPIRARRH
jgi:transposase